MARNRFIPAFIIVTALLLVGFILVRERQALAQVRERVRQEHRLQFRSCAEHVHDYFGAIYSLLLFVSVDEDVTALRQSSRPYIEKLFEHGLEQNQLTEVYIVERGFDGKRRPFMTFERGSQGIAAAEVHSFEREQDEYQVQQGHLGQFEQAPAIRALLSPEIPLCVLAEGGAQARGHVYSVPIRLGGQFVGLVAGMLRSDSILEVLERAGKNYVPALVNEQGQIILESTAPTPIRQWLASEARRRRLPTTTGALEETRELKGWVGLSARARLESGDKWWLVYFYRAEQESRSDVLLGAAGHGALAGSVLLAAVALASLVTTLNRRVAEQELHLRQRKELERQVQEVSDRAQRRAGEGLHEDLCQRLAGVEAVAKVLEKKLKVVGLAEAELARELCGEVKDTLSSARHMADELQPISLLQDGFVVAVATLAANVRTRRKIPCEVQADHFPELLDPALGTHLYRIVQEALNNVVRHAAATAAGVKLSSADGRLRIEVSDNGKGFNPLNQPAQGMGLRIMRYRSELIGAELSVVSSPGKGTVVTCTCPLDSPAGPYFSAASP